MFQLRRRGPVTYDDVLRELEMIERQMLHVDSALAMNLMVVEAKLRERFRQMEAVNSGIPSTSEEPSIAAGMLSMDDIRAMIPQDLPPFPTLEDCEPRPRRTKALETIGIAAGLAIVTALGVFGLASVLQLALAWLA